MAPRRSRLGGGRRIQPGRNQLRSRRSEDVWAGIPCRPSEFTTSGVGGAAAAATTAGTFADGSWGRRGLATRNRGRVACVVGLSGCVRWSGVGWVCGCVVVAPVGQVVAFVGFSLIWTGLVGRVVRRGQAM